jgi:DNA-binding response OmpR family regulator
MIPAGKESEADHLVKKPKAIKDRKPNILIVDDSMSVRKFVGSILEKKGFGTFTSDSGEEALKTMEKNDIDLVITDLEMPNMDGFTLITHIKNSNKYKDMPIIILTGRSSEEKQKEGLQRGADAFIVKPFKEDELLQTIGKFIIK